MLSTIQLGVFIYVLIMAHRHYTFMNSKALFRKNIFDSLQLVFAEFQMIQCLDRIFNL